METEATRSGLVGHHFVELVSGIGIIELGLNIVRRLVEPARRSGKDLAAVGGDAKRMLELCRQAAVSGDRGPAVGEDFDVRPAGVDHRLDGEKHALFEPQALAGPAEMQDTGRRVKDLTEPVTAEIADHRKALGLDIGLDRVADIAHAFAMTTINQ